MANQQSQSVSPSPVEGMMHIMRSVLIQVSGLAGILAFLAQMWSHNPLDESLYTGVIVGGGVYIILLLVDVTFQQIVAAHVKSTREKARAQAQKASSDDEQESTEIPAQETSASTPAGSPEGEKQASSDEAAASAPALAAESSAANPSADQETVQA